MMGATLSLALVLWLASSYVEYKIVSASPHLERWFHGVSAIAISLVISLTLGYLLAPAAGVAVVLAAFLGLATNEFTFSLFDRLHRMNVKRNAAKARVTAFKSSHPTLFHEAVEGVKAGFMVITMLFLAIVWIFGLPVRIVRWTQAAISHIKTVYNTRVKTAFSR